VKITVPWLQRAEIEKTSEEVLARFNKQRMIPVPVDTIIERDYGIDIVPVAGLKEELENDAFISRDFTTIHVDQHVYFNVEVRYRFSLAHELGHLVLHRRIFQDLAFSTIEEWTEVYQAIDSDDYGKLEFQANAFAGYLLMPSFALVQDFASALSGMKDRISLVKEKGVPREAYLESVIGNMARRLAPSFNVSTACAENRIKNEERCLNLIP